MSHRDSDSRRRYSKFDRDPSPKRYRRDGKQEEIEKDRVTLNGGRDHDHVDRDQRNSHYSKHQPSDAAHKKSNPNDPPKHASRSSSHYQHDERARTEQVSRFAGRREVGGKGKVDNERSDTTTQGRGQRDERSQAKLDGNLQRRDGFHERKDNPPPTTRKRPAFREKKIPMDTEDANPPVPVTVRSSHTDHPPERKEERSSNPQHLDSYEKQIVEDRAPNKSEVKRDGFSSRPRYGGRGGISNYRGRDNFNGRQGYHSIKARTEKWKHDLYQEVNKDPVTKNEDDQIAKLEALLAS